MVAAGTAPVTAGTAAAPSVLFPCDVADVVSNTCTRCHGSVLRQAAPMALLTPADFSAERNGSPVYQATMARLHDMLRPMPPPPDPPLTAAQLAVMDAWLAAGAQSDPAGCPARDASREVDAGMPVAGMGVDSGTAGTAGEPPKTTDQGVTTGPRWTLFGFDLNNSRANPDEEILGADNVAGMRRLWEVPVRGSTSTPAVADGVVYLPAWDGKVHALRLDDGGVVWTASLPDLIDSSPALSADRVFVSDDSGVVHALNRETGGVEWSQEVDDHPEAHLWSSPVFVPEANLIVIGVASGDEALPPGSQTFAGSVVGLDSDTGMERFRFDTTSGGGGVGIAVWATAAVDTERKLVFIGTGNNYTAPTGQYADSMLAINYETGQLAWFHQFTADDVFVVSQPTGPDYDIGASANLFSAGGKDLIGIGVKSGNYFAMDRDTGVIEWMTMITAGSPLGGVISSSAYSDGVIYVASNVSLMGNTKLAALRAADGRVAHAGRPGEIPGRVRKRRPRSLVLGGGIFLKPAPKLALVIVQELLFA